MGVRGMLAREIDVGVLPCGRPPRDVQFVGAGFTSARLARI